MTIKNPAIPSHFLARLEQATTFDNRYEVHNDSSVLDDAIAIWKSIVDDASFARTQMEFQVACLNDGGTSFLNRFHAQGLVSDLDIAVDWWTRASNMLKAPDTDLLTNIGRAHHEKYQLLADTDALQAAYNYCRKARQADPKDPVTCSQLGLVLMDLYNVVGDAKHLFDARECFDTGLDAFTNEDLRNEWMREMYSSLMNNLGMALATTFLLTGEHELGEKARKCFEKALEISPHSPHTAIRRANLLSIRRDLGDIQ